MYKEELTRAMGWLGQQPDVVFVGQGVVYGGNAIFDTLKDVPLSKRIELPVMEDAQLGLSLGMAMMGKTVISIYPRMDFLMCAMNQLVNHLDKNIYPLKGKVIIRTCVGSTKPMYPGAQHCGDYTMGLETLLQHTPVFSLEGSGEIAFVYKQIYQGIWTSLLSQDSHRASIIVERADLYGME